MSRVIAAFTQFFDGEGNPLADGWLHFLYSNTNNTDKNTYADEELSIPNSNPLQLDAEGRCPDAFGTGQYRVVLYKDDPVLHLPGVQVAQFDPVNAENSSTGSGTNFETWEATTEYSILDIATHNGFYYRSLINSNLGNAPDTNLDKWEKIDFLRYWNVNVTYALNDVVISGNGLYFSLADSNVGNTPLTSPTWWTPVGNGTIFLNWSESGTTLQPNIAGYNLGAAGNEIGNFYQGDNSYHYFGDGQDAHIVHDGTDFYIKTTTGDIKIQVQHATGDFEIYTGAGPTLGFLLDQSQDAYFYGDVNLDTGGKLILPSDDDAASPTIQFDDQTGFYSPSAGRVDFAMAGVLAWIMNANYLYSNTTLGGAIYSQAGSSTVPTFTFVDDINTGVGRPDADEVNLIAGGVDIVHAYATAVSIFMPLTVTGDILPAAAATYDLGSDTADFANIYLGDASYIYLSDSQDSYIVSGSSNVTIHALNQVILSTPAVSGDSIVFAPYAVNQWEIDTSGDFLPIGGARDIGSATYETGSIFMDNGEYFYVGPNGAIYDAAGTVLQVRCSTGNYIQIGPSQNIGTQDTPDANSIVLRVATASDDSDNAWYIKSTTGDLIPQTSTLSPDIGNATSGVTNLYMSSGGSIFVGDDQELQIYNQSGSSYIKHIPAAAGRHMLIGVYGSTGQLGLVTDSITQWLIDVSGDMFPLAGALDIGSASYPVGSFYCEDIYVADDGYARFGASNDGIIGWNNSTTELRIEPTTDNTGILKFGRTAMNWSNIYINSNTAIKCYTAGAVRFEINVSGEIDMPAVYSDTVTGRDLYIASDGKLGYVSSTGKNKTEFKKLKDADLSWIYDLTPQEYEYDPDKVHGAVPGEKEFGLIAEEVELVNPELVDYDIDPKTGAKTPAAVKHRNLVGLMLQEIHNLNKRIATLEAA